MSLTEIDKTTDAAEKIDEKEAAIIDAARKTFLSRGYDAASMDVIALVAGVSKRTVYNRFRSKEELFGETITATCRRVLPVNFESIEADLPLDAYIREMSSRFLHGMLEPEAIALRRIATFEAGRNPALGKSYLDHGPRFMVEACVPMLKHLAERGLLRVRDPERAIWQLGSLIIEPLYTIVLLGDPPPNLDEEIDKQIESGVRAFLALYSA